MSNLIDTYGSNFGKLSKNRPKHKETMFYSHTILIEKCTKFKFQLKQCRSLWECLNYYLIIHFYYQKHPENVVQIENSTMRENKGSIRSALFCNI